MVVVVIVVVAVALVVVVLAFVLVIVLDESSEPSGAPGAPVPWDVAAQ